MKIQLCTTLLVLVVISAYPLFCESQTTDSTFVKKVQGVGALIQTIQAADRTYVSLSQTGDRNFIARKIIASGQKVWERTIHFPLGDDLYSYSLDAIAQTSDGGYILAGRVNCNSFYCYDDYYRFSISGILVKLRSNGSVQWKKDYYHNRDSYYSFTSVVPVPGGGFIATAGTSLGGPDSPLDLVKFTSDGNVVWIKSFTDSAPADYKLVSGSDNGFFLVSGTPNTVSRIIKVNDSGSIVWKKSVETPDFVFQRAAATSDNGLVIAGKCKNCNQLSLVQLKTDGTVGWRAKYSLQSPRVHSITDLIQTPDGGYAINGTFGGEGGQDAKAFLLKIDSSREIVFLQAFNTAGVRGGSVFHASNGGYLIFRPMGQGLLISSVDSNGTTTGCNLFYSTTALRIPFGQLKVEQPATREASSDTLGISDIALRSAASSSPESIVCQ